jgi:hypothetical protein
MHQAAKVSIGWERERRRDMWRDPGRRWKTAEVRNNMG